MIALLLSSLLALADTPWQHPDQAVLDVLDAPDIPSVWTSPGGAHLLLADPVRYPPLADRAAAMVPLAGLRVDARNNGHHGRSGYTGARVRDVATGAEVAVATPDGARLLGVDWSADGDKLALTLMFSDHIGLWVGGADGAGGVVDGLSLDPLLGDEVQWMPGQTRLLVKRIPARGEPPPAPLVPPGPVIRDADGETASSTYEARDLLASAHDDDLFTYYATSQLALVDAASRAVTPVGQPAVLATASPAPRGDLLLVERLVGPWSHRVAWGHFASEVEVWDLSGQLVHRVASLPVAEHVPIHGVAEGPRGVSWRASAPATLVWVEALDGGDWSNEVPHRDRMMMAAAPFSKPPVEVFRAEHRVQRWWWGADRGLALVAQYERSRRWQHVWTLDVDRKKSRALYDLSVNDRYADPGAPVTRRRMDGTRVLEQVGGDLFFVGVGGSPTGDRPFLDRRSLKTGAVERLFRSAADRYESFIGFVDAEEGIFLASSESERDPPNVVEVSLGAPVAAAEGEATRARRDRAVTAFSDPTPQLRALERRIVTYTRDDGVPLSFELVLPPGAEPGVPLPTVLHAYPREYSDPATAGQIRGSEHTFTEIDGTSHLFFALQGYAVLHNTQLPVIGDPDTAYDTFVPQLVAGAKAAIDEAVRLGVTDPERVGAIGHSHGGLMTATLLAHSDLFKAGIARSGAYNHTIRPFGFQSERRTLWEARDTYLALSPVMFAPQINEPLLLIHGEMDENPGTVPYQSERLFEAVRGTGGTVRLLMLPYEGHGYRARESVEHVLWEQARWFDRYVKGEGGGE